MNDYNDEYEYVYNAEKDAYDKVRKSDRKYSYQNQSPDKMNGMRKGRGLSIALGIFAIIAFLFLIVAICLCLFGMGDSYLMDVGLLMFWMFFLVFIPVFLIVSIFGCLFYGPRYRAYYGFGWMPFFWWGGFHRPFGFRFHYHHMHGPHGGPGGPRGGMGGPGGPRGGGPR